MTLDEANLRSDRRWAIPRIPENLILIRCQPEDRLYSFFWSVNQRQLKQ